MCEHELMTFLILATVINIASETPFTKVKVDSHRTAKIKELHLCLVVQFLHNNALPHIARLTKEKLMKLRWEILIHLPYFPDLVPPDFHLF